jgi:DNA polymerase-4
MALRTLYVDFNSYFASVEQQLRPELRGQPVGVVPVMADTTCCIAASYEAKKFGIKTGTLVSEAKARCPDIRLVEARPLTYVEFHHRLVEVVESCTPVDKVYSIDEMACELTGSQQQRENAIRLGKEIKARIAEKVGAFMRCSVGIAPNTFLAKTATDMEKPDGFVIIDDADLPGCLYRLKLRELCGIGPAMETRLLSHGISTVEQLTTATKAQLRKVWNGIEGERWYAKLRGEVTFAPPTNKSTIGHQHVLPPDERTDKAALAVLYKLLQKAAVRLRSYDYMAGGVQLGIKCVNGSRWSQQMRFDHTWDTIQLCDVLERLWSQRPKGKPLMVGVTLFELLERRGSTPSLFGEDIRRDRLNEVVDRLNSRFGGNTIYFGGAQSALDSAPMRIAFSHIPDLKLED